MYFTNRFQAGKVSKTPNIILYLPQNNLRSKLWRILLIILISGDTALNPGPQDVRNLCIGSWNINSLSKDAWNPVDELRNGLLKNIDVLGLQETKLDSSISDASLKINGYQIIWRDYRRRSSGLLFYVTNSLTVRTLIIPEFDLLHVLAIKVCLPNSSLVIANVYRRPVALKPAIEDELHRLAALL